MILSSSRILVQRLLIIPISSTASSEKCLSSSCSNLALLAIFIAWSPILSISADTFTNKAIACEPSRGSSLEIAEVVKSTISLLR